MRCFKTRRARVGGCRASDVISVQICLENGTIGVCAAPQSPTPQGKRANVMHVTAWVQGQVRRRYRYTVRYVSGGVFNAFPTWNGAVSRAGARISSKQRIPPAGASKVVGRCIILTPLLPQLRYVPLIHLAAQSRDCHPQSSRLKVQLVIYPAINY